jgi:hypothetical protein
MELVGLPISDKSIEIGPNAFIDPISFIYSKHWSEKLEPLGGIGNGNTVSAPANFMFPGIREDLLLSPDATLIIEFKGLNETVVTQVPSHLIEHPVII